ncbi:hypothetical protein GCM10009716_26540 [Streptomyces sodiiphilus]|uniref:Pentapeptide repeat-containing protein n=1 Tax=Streptomyces sodiiphilus TaxID=226217 RepID=A0ABP5AMB9_9ACTN
MKRISGWIAAVIGIALFFLLLWQGPWWFDGARLQNDDLEPADAMVVTGFRTMLIATGAGVIAGLGLHYTHRNHQHTLKLFDHTRDKDREQADLTREGQVTERYVEAIKLLASDNMTERLGGIYSLERIMRDSEKDHATVVAVLAAFVRQHAPWTEPPPERTSPEEDVQAVLNVLGGRPERPEGFCVDLRATDLRGADLRGGQLEGANLAGTHLENADLTQAQLRYADLSEAALRGADLTEAQLRYADLTQADLGNATLTEANLGYAGLAQACLENAILIEAHLENAILSRADLTGADLTQARLDNTILASVDLTRNTSLTVAQLACALLHTTTALPPDLADDPVIRARIGERDPR